MQRFVNNWSTTLLAPLLAGDSELSVSAAMAAKVAACLQDPGDYLDLTISPEGAAPEIIRVTGAGTGVLEIGGRGGEGTATPGSWPAGTVIRCTVTAGFLHGLQSAPSVGGGSRSIVVISLGEITVPADAGLLVGGGYATDSSQVTLPVPDSDQVLAIDLLLYQTAESPGDPAYELQLTLPGGVVGDVQVPSATTSVTSATLTLSNITTLTFCRLLISNSGGTLQLDLAAYSPALAASIPS